MATTSLRIVQFDDETRELMQELRGYLREERAIQQEIATLLDKFMQVASFDISEEVTVDDDNIFYGIHSFDDLVNG